MALARDYGRVVVTLAVVLGLLRFGIDPRSGWLLWATGVLAVVVTALSLRWVQLEVALIRVIRRRSRDQ
jgi:hypothetical protein